MVVYKDILTGDEMFSDAFPVKLVDDIVYEVDCAMIKVKDRSEDGLEEGIQIFIDVIHSFRLQRTEFDQKTDLYYLQSYARVVKNRLPADRQLAFTKGVQTFVKKIIPNFKDYHFYTGESRDNEGLVALLNYREDGVTPYLTFWKDGLEEVTP
ncbi:hypothetical protein CVT24_001627 [Panaeolus cyanescens]|uniref:Translationally-controlled tumor protein homolog n=1 Tax=Panaeolus cyanescens TaxID=181874 RepID=A0A409W3F7_9AGAR|nr:hypothetical protein CVT24_001627 [Panaeolus cyanescens]